MKRSHHVAAELIDATAAATLFDDLVGGTSERTALAGLGIQVVAWPGDVPPALRAGDMLLRRALGEGRLAFLASIVSAKPMTRMQLEADGVYCEQEQGGYFIEIARGGEHRASRQAWRLTGSDRRVAADSLILRPTAAETDRWADEKAWVRSKLDEKDYIAAARWLNGQSKAVIERHFLSWMRPKDIARLHIAARRHVGRGSQFARITRHRFLVYRVRWAVKKQKWDKAATWLNGFSRSEIRHFLARFPLSVVGELHRAAVRSVGRGSNVARMTNAAGDIAYFKPRNARKARGGSQLLNGWRDKGRPSDWIARERTIRKEISLGNVPGWLRRWIPVPVEVTMSGGGRMSGTVFVLPDYLAVGDDTDFVYMPFDKYSAQRIATEMGAMLPTAKICHSVFLEAERLNQQLVASTRDYWDRSARRKVPRDRQSTSDAAYSEHSEDIRNTIGAKPFARGALVAGHKKDVIIAADLHKPGQWKKVAYHGFYNKQGIPFEPCFHTRTGALRPNCQRDTATLAHAQPDGRFSDYSQGVRLVHRWMEVNGRPVRVRKVLKRSKQSRLISAEGPIVPARITAPPRRR